MQQDHYQCTNQSPPHLKAYEWPALNLNCALLQISAVVERHLDQSFFLSSLNTCRANPRTNKLRKTTSFRINTLLWGGKKPNHLVVGWCSACFPLWPLPRLTRCTQMLSFNRAGFHEEQQMNCSCFIHWFFANCYISLLTDLLNTDSLHTVEDFCTTRTS